MKISRRSLIAGLASCAAAIGARIPAAEPLAEAIPAAPIPPWCPPGWLPCDGRELLERTHGDLFAALGRSYGGSEERGTFRLPSFMDAFSLEPRPGHVTVRVARVIKATPTAPDMENIPPYGAVAAPPVGIVAETWFTTAPA